MSETTKVRIVNSPASLWLIGWLFTLGYLLPTFSETMTFWETIGTLGLTYILWPLFLGSQLAGSGLL